MMVTLTTNKGDLEIKSILLVAAFVRAECEREEELDPAKGCVVRTLPSLSSYPHLLQLLITV